MTLHRITANVQGADGVRRDVFEGQDHLVVPVVMIVEGVLNGAMVPQSEFGRHVEAWNGRPIPVLHPEENGAAISANRPDIIERNTIGQIFSARSEGGKLKAEAWVNVAKAGRLGYGDLVAQLETGAVVEVSTGYFADDENKSGEFNGVAYHVIHRNLRPDHLALLPGQIGACSVKDGCGTRVNSKKETFAMKVNEAWAVLSKHLGLKSNCECEDNMDILKQAEGMVKANALDAKQLAAIQGMEPKDREVMAAFIAALGATGGDDEMGEVEEMEDAAPEEETPPMVQTQSKKAGIKTMPEADLDTLVANRVADHLRRHDVVGKLTANDANKLTADQMKAMSVEQLEAVEQMIRPADYSGQGGFATNSDVIDANVTPLVPRGILATHAKKGA